MKKIGFLLTGILFGIIMTKSEAVSWFRIQEMFRFHSIHMYGIIGVAVLVGILIHVILKKIGMKDVFGNKINILEKPKTYKASLFGGTIFGLGWAVTGACPGPLYVLIGHGHLSIILVILSALLGALCYGRIKTKLPH